MSETAETTETDEGTEETTTDPVAEQRAWMEEKFAGIESRLPETEAAAEPGSLSQQIQGEENLEGLSDEELDELEGEYGEDEWDGMSAQEQFDAYLEQKLEERVGPIQQELTQRQEQEALDRIDAIQEKYPDLKSDPALQRKVADRVTGLAKELNNESILFSATAVELAYKAIKAEAASANEVTAESAATGEASLETGAGPSQQGEADPGDEYRNELKQMANEKSGAF